MSSHDPLTALQPTNIQYFKEKKHMKKADELREPTSCLSKASPDEPIFVLRANDPLAPQTIRAWAAMAHDEHEVPKIQDAQDLAEAMENWHAQNVPQVVQD